MDSTHREELGDICVDDMEWMDNFTYVNEAIAVAEREGWPLLGLAVTRRSEPHCQKVQGRSNTVSHLLHLCSTAHHLLGVSRG